MGPNFAIFRYLPWRKNTQVQKFREAAKEAGTDESEERFNATLKDLAKAPRDAGEAGQNESGEEAKPKR
jgi:hypothetical protein